MNVAVMQKCKLRCGGRLASTLGIEHGYDFVVGKSNRVNDAVFSPVEVERAMAELHPLLLQELGEGERAMLHKPLAVLSYASTKELSLFGVAD